MKKSSSLYENSVKYPSAKSLKTGEPSTIQDVKHEERHNFICPDCNNSFIAVLKHQTPHFKHKPKSSCVGSFESNIHWLAKEIFKRITEFEVPEIKIDDLPEKQRQSYQEIFNKIIQDNIPEKIRGTYRKAVKKEFIDERIISVNKIEIEREFITDIGNIVVDIITYSENERIFIEPFYSNPVSIEKKKKLLKVGTQTLSIDLIKFMNNFKLDFNNEEFKEYLISKESKEWILTSVQNFDEHLENYEKHLLEVIELNKGVIDSYNSKLNELKNLETQKKNKVEKLNEIKSEIDKLDMKINKIEEKLDY